MSQLVAFEYWPRSNKQLSKQALVGATIELDERQDYILELRSPPAAGQLQRLLDLGGQMLTNKVVALGFGNFVGRTEFAGVGIEVTSTKVGNNGVSRILEDVSKLASNLIYGWKAPTRFGALADTSRHAPVPYHQLQFLRRTMIESRPGDRLQDWMAAIEQNPTRRFEQDRPVVSVSRATRVDNRALRSIVSRIERLVPVSSSVSVAASPLARALTFGVPPRAHFPQKVAVPKGSLSFDTPENRFIKHVVTECLALVYRFLDHQGLHRSLRADCRTMLAQLQQYLTVPFITESERLTHFAAPNQVLLKANGYREVFDFWNALTRHVSLPRGGEETMRLLEGRDMATLYEYWVFLHVLNAVSVTVGQKPSRVEIRRGDLGDSLSLGFSTSVGSDMTVSFNQTFGRTNYTSYSTPLRPDVTVETDGALYSFDAKYRLDRFEGDMGVADTDDSSTYKRADLYKMHTYRDAIRNVKAAFAVYPGEEFVFFERSGYQRSRATDVVAFDGVGAIPLVPSKTDPAAELNLLVECLLAQEAGSASSLASLSQISRTSE